MVVDDVDAHYARAKAAGAEIVIDIKTQDYGGRDYTARDLEGHVWTFGSYDPVREAQTKLDPASPGDAGSAASPSIQKCDWRGH